MFVQDKSVSTGMFSKAGRFTVEMYSLLQEKDYVMSGQKKTFSNIDRSELHKKSQSLPQINANISTQAKNPKLKKKEDQPFFKTVTREHYNKLEEQKINNGKFGMYEAKHHYIYGNSPLYEDKEFINENKKRTITFREKLFSQNKHNLKNLKQQLSQKKLLKPIETSQLNTQRNNLYYTQQQQQNSQIQCHQNHENHHHNNTINVLQDLHNNTNQSQLDNTFQNQNNSIASMPNPMLTNLEQSQISGINQSMLNKSIVSTDSLLYGIDYDKKRRKILGHIVFDKKVPAQGIQPH